MNKVKHFEPPGDVTPVTVTVTTAAPKELLVIGSEGSGKTLLCRRMLEYGMKNPASISPENTVPTTGTEITELTFCCEARSVAVVCREVGSAMSSSWGKYLLTSSCVLFVVDISDPGSFPSSMIHLNELLSSLKRIEADDNEDLGLDRQDKGRDESCDSKLQENGVLQKIIPTVLIVLNKTDLADPTTHALAINFLRLGDIVSLHHSPPQRCVQIFSGSCMNLQLSAALLKWIRTNIKM